MYSSTSSKSTREVTFSQSSQLAFIPEDNAESKWYSTQEKQKHQEELIRDVRRMRNEINRWQYESLINSSSPSNNITSEQLIKCIGIEAFVTQGLAMNLVKRKRAHVLAVLTEQGLQKQQGIHDAKNLGDVSENILT